MESTFRELEKAGKADVEHLMQWMEDSDIIKDMENNARHLFNDVADQQHVDLAKFKDILGKIADEQSKTVEQLSNQLAAEGPKYIEAAISNMESTFRQLENAGKADVEHLMQWMEDSEIIKAMESNARQLFKDVADQQHVDLTKFKDILGKIADEQSKTVEQLSNQLAAEGPKYIEAAISNMDSTFRQLENAGKADVEHLLQWMEDSEIIKAMESNARQLFEDVADQQHVDLAKFKDILGKIADEQSKTVEQLSNQLAAEGPTYIEAAISNMESTFRQLENAGKVDVEHLMQWMEDSDIIKAMENNARQLFKDVADQQHVDLAKFKDILGKIAGVQSKTVEQLSDQLAAKGPKYIEAAFSNMESTFRQLENTGKADVEHLLQWMEDSDIIKAMESNARQLFKDVADQQHVDLTKFKDILGKIADEQSKTVEQLSNQLAAEGPKYIEAAISNMDSTFRQLENAGKADVEHLMQWMEDSDIIKAMESNARQLFKDVADQQHVDLTKFKDILGKIADEQSKTVEQLSNQLAAEGPKYIEAAISNMESTFRQLEKAGKADVEHLLQWMEDSEIIKAMESNARQLFNDVADQQHVDLAKFKDILAKIADEQSKTVEQLSNQLAAEGPKYIEAAISNMESTFRQLEKAGKADVEHLLQWMEDSEIIKAMESNARQLFNDVADQQHVDLAKFKDILGKIADEQSKTVEQLSNQLAAEGPKFIDAVKDGLNALTHAFNVAGPASSGGPVKLAASELEEESKPESERELKSKS